MQNFNKNFSLQFRTTEQEIQNQVLVYTQRGCKIMRMKKQRTVEKYNLSLKEFQSQPEERQQKKL